MKMGLGSFDRKENARKGEHGYLASESRGGRDWDPRRGAIWRPQWAGAVRPRDVIPGRD